MNFKKNLENLGEIHSQKLSKIITFSIITHQVLPRRGQKTLNNGYVTHFWISPFYAFYTQSRLTMTVSGSIHGGRCTVHPKTLPHTLYTHVYHKVLQKHLLFKSKRTN